MKDCNAKITPAEVTDEVVDTVSVNSYGDKNFYAEKIPDGMTVQRQGDRLVRVDLHVLGCEQGQTHTPAMSHQHPDVDWWDSTPGATPHEDPCVMCGGSGDAFGSFACDHCDGTGREPDVEVSEAEFEAFVEVWYARPANATLQQEHDAMYEALLAAKRAEKEQA